MTCYCKCHGGDLKPYRLTLAFVIGCIFETDNSSKNLVLWWFQAFGWTTTWVVCVHGHVCLGASRNFVQIIIILHDEMNHFACVSCMCHWMFWACFCGDVLDMGVVWVWSEISQIQFNKNHLQSNSFDRMLNPKTWWTGFNWTRSN